MRVRSTEGSLLNQHGEGQQQAEEQQDEEQGAAGVSRPVGGSVGAQEGGLLDCFLALAVLQVSADAGSVAHGVGQVALLLDAVEEVRHGPACQHGHVLATVRGGLHGNGGLLNVVFALWKPRRGSISGWSFKLVHILDVI